MCAFSCCGSSLLSNTLVFVVVVATGVGEEADADADDPASSRSHDPDDARRSPASPVGDMSARGRRGWGWEASSGSGCREAGGALGSAILVLREGVAVLVKSSSCESEREASVVGRASAFVCAFAFAVMARAFASGFGGEAGSRRAWTFSCSYSSSSAADVVVSLGRQLAEPSTAVSIDLVLWSTTGALGHRAGVLSRSSLTLTSAGKLGRSSPPSL